MPTIKVNGTNNSLVHKGSDGVSAATLPDVCKTPSPGGPVPVPYPNVSRTTSLSKGTKSVKADGGNMIAVDGSEFSTSTGDEPGTAGGVKSGTFAKESTWITYSFDVKMEGKGACRLGDKMFQNHGNTVDLAGEAQAPVAGAKAKDCKELAKQAREGDIVVRSTPGEDSDLIRKLGRCEFSHAGIVTKDATGKLVVTDAYPGRGPGDKNAVGNESVEDFFCSPHHGPPDKGLLARPKDSNIAKKAAEWAQKQTTDPAYKFDIFSDFRTTPKDVYCSDFVHQAFQNAGVDVVPTPMDFMSAANKQNTIDGVREFKSLPRLLISDRKIESEIKKTISNFEYITPCQVARNPNVSTVSFF